MDHCSLDWNSNWNELDLYGMDLYGMDLQESLQRREREGVSFL